MRLGCCWYDAPIGAKELLPAAFEAASWKLTVCCALYTTQRPRQPLDRGRMAVRFGRFVQPIVSHARLLDRLDEASLHPADLWVHGLNLF